MFIQAASQGGLAWNRQMNSELAEDFRLVTMDMRGHGLSDKPREGYTESRLWADDVNAAIQSLGTRGPDPLRVVVWTTRHPGLHPALRRGQHRRHQFRWWHYKAWQ